MATDLRGRLHDLADRTPPTAPPPDLWSRGVRRRRASQAGTSVLVAALVLILGVGAWSWHADEQRIEPVAPHGTPHLPDRFFVPSPWLPTFDGAPGALVAMGVSTRKTLLHTERGMYGVTASSGVYGFLDLPGLSDDAKLSPDGRYVGYWSSGPTSGSPHTSDGPVTAGVAVYDTTTGDLIRHPITTVHGVTPNLMTWTPDDHLIVDFDHWLGGDGDSEELRSETEQETTLAWDGVTGDFRSVRPTDEVSFFDLSSPSGAPVIMSGDAEDDYRVYHLEHPAATWSFQWGDAPPSQNSMTLNASLDRFAAVSGGPSGQPRLPNTIVAGRFPPGPDPGRPELTFPVVAHSGHTFEVLAWLDRHHVALLRQDPIGADVTYRVDRLDVRTGAATTLVHDLPDVLENEQYAANLLAAPTSHASPPPRSRDLRWLVGGIGFGLLVLALVGYRRSRGRRA